MSKANPGCDATCPNYCDHDQLITKLVEALELSEKAMSIVSDWDSYFPEGLEIADGKWVRPYSVLVKIRSALALPELKAWRDEIGVK